MEGVAAGCRAVAGAGGVRGVVAAVMVVMVVHHISLHTGVEGIRCCHLQGASPAHLVTGGGGGDPRH